MSTINVTRRDHDIAYACFIAPGLLSLIAKAAHLIPMSTGTAGGIGFLILIPLSLVSLITVPIGIFSSITFRKDAALVILSIATVLRVAQIIGDFGSVKIYNMLGLLYGILVLVLELSWFLFRRKRTYPA